MTTSNEDFERPSRLLWRAEAPRALAELAQFWAAYPVLALGARGDGHTVLTLPGFVADDASMRPLRTLLRARGYHPKPWTLGRNMGPSQRVLDGLSRRLTTVHRESGRRVSLIGWSLGGIYARDLARRHPDLVRLVVTLGSPFRLDPRGDNRHSTRTGELFAATRPSHGAEFTTRPPEAEQPPLPVPATAVYSRTDGVVPWRSCLERGGPTRENVEVIGSHCGLGHNVCAVTVILDRLALPEDGWRPWRRQRAAFAA